MEDYERMSRARRAGKLMDLGAIRDALAILRTTVALSEGRDPAPFRIESSAQAADGGVRD